MPLRVGPFFLGPPTAADRAAVEASAPSLPYTFPHVGVTKAAPPLPEPVASERWTLDHHCVQIGRGRDAYRKAQRLLQQWRHFDLGWASTNTPAVKEGAPVVITAKTLFCWSCNPLRISFVEEGGLRPQQLPPWAPSSSGKCRGGSRGVGTRAEQQPQSRQQQQQQQQKQQQQAARPPRGRRYAFAHTTLRGHQISGEERFAVAWNQEDDSVWYEIYTLSRPGDWITVATRPLLRAFQRKFAADSMAAMQHQMQQQ